MYKRKSNGILRKLFGKSKKDRRIKNLRIQNVWRKLYSMAPSFLRPALQEVESKKFTNFTETHNFVGIIEPKDVYVVREKFMLTRNLGCPNIRLKGSNKDFKISVLTKYMAIYARDEKCVSCNIKINGYAVWRDLQSKNARYKIRPIHMAQPYYGICDNTFFSKVVTEEITIDHIYPRSLGGKNNFSNLQAMCSTCNKKKSNKLSSLYRLEGRTKNGLKIRTFFFAEAYEVHMAKSLAYDFGIEPDTLEVYAVKGTNGYQVVANERIKHFPNVGSAHGFLS